MRGLYFEEFEVGRVYRHPFTPHGHRVRQRAVHVADHEHPAAAPGPRVRQGHDPRPAAVQQPVHPGVGRRLPRAGADVRHHTGEPGLRQREVPAPGLPRGHAARGDDDPGQAGEQEQDRQRHRLVRAPRLQPARRADHGLHPRRPDGQVPRARWLQPGRDRRARHPPHPPPTRRREHDRRPAELGPHHPRAADRRPAGARRGPGHRGPQPRHRAGARHRRHGVDRPGRPGRRRRAEGVPGLGRRLPAGAQRRHPPAGRRLRGSHRAADRLDRQRGGYARRLRRGDAGQARHRAPALAGRGGAGRPDRTAGGVARPGAELLRGRLPAGGGGGLHHRLQLPDQPRRLQVRRGAGSRLHDGAAALPAHPAHHALDGRAVRGGRDPGRRPSTSSSATGPRSGST